MNNKKNRIFPFSFTNCLRLTASIFDIGTKELKLVSTYLTANITFL